MFTSSFDSFVYTKTAAQAILGGICLRIEVWSNCLFVICKVGSKKIVRFVSKHSFHRYFADSRKQRGKAIEVTANAFDTTKFTARSSAGDTLYNLHALRGGVECDCDDYRNQMSLFGNGKKLCKHGYAVLNVLGYGTLKSYLEAQANQF